MTTEQPVSRKVRGQHNLNLFVSEDLKTRLKALAERYDRTVADIVRSVLRLGIPMMEGMSQAEESMLKEYTALFRRLRKVRSLKDL